MREQDYFYHLMVMIDAYANTVANHRIAVELNKPSLEILKLKQLAIEAKIKIEKFVIHEALS